MPDTTVDSSAAIRRTIDAYLAAFTASDREAWLDLFAEDAWIEDPVGTPRRNGREEIGAFWDETHTVPDAIELRSLGITNVIGNEAAFVMQALPRIGDTTYVIDIVDLMTFDENARITTMRAFFESGTMRPLEE